MQAILEVVNRVISDSFQLDNNNNNNNNNNNKLYFKIPLRLDVYDTFQYVT